jgi:hypothetical protein
MLLIVEAEVVVAVAAELAFLQGAGDQGSLEVPFRL